MYSESHSEPNYEELNDQAKNNLNGSFSSLHSLSFYVYPNEERKRKLKNRFLFCCLCYSSPKISFLHDNLLRVSCDCKKLINIRTSDFIEHYTCQQKSKIKDFFKCKEHNEYLYSSYCTDCKVNCCQKCLTETKIHENHTMENLLDVDDIIKETKRLIKITRKKLPKGDIEYRKILNLMECLIKNYKEYPSHNLYKSIFNAKEFLTKLNIPNMTEMIKIRTINELKMNIDNSHLISSIKINNEKFSDLSIFEQLDLSNLIKLQLQKNEIKNIEPLLKCDFSSLKFFDIEDNKISDEGFENFDKMKFRNIEYINLFQNEIKSPTIFEKVTNFETLKVFYVGKNLFDIDEIQKNINKQYSLTQIKEIGLTGDFTDDTIHFIKNFKFSNLEILYISRNNLTSLAFLNNVICPKLKEFWSVRNKLESFDDILKLPYKKTITKINLKENKISKIDNLVKFISYFPKLKELNLLKNPINLKDPKNKKIIEEVKAKYKYLQLNL